MRLTVSLRDAENGETLVDTAHVPDALMAAWPTARRADYLETMYKRLTNNVVNEWIAREDHV